MTIVSSFDDLFLYDYVWNGMRNSTAESGHKDMPQTKAVASNMLRYD